MQIDCGISIYLSIYLEREGGRGWEGEGERGRGRDLKTHSGSNLAWAGCHPIDRTWRTLFFLVITSICCCITLLTCLIEKIHTTSEGFNSA